MNNFNPFLREKFMTNENKNSISGTKKNSQVEEVEVTYPTVAEVKEISAMPNVFNQTVKATQALRNMAMLIKDIPDEAVVLKGTSAGSSLKAEAYKVLGFAQTCNNSINPLWKEASNTAKAKNPEADNTALKFKTIDIIKPLEVQLKKKFVWKTGNQ